MITKTIRAMTRTAQTTMPTMVTLLSITVSSTCRNSGGGDSPVSTDNAGDDDDNDDDETDRDTERALIKNMNRIAMFTTHLLT
jgi:hypothetical protein